MLLLTANNHVIRVVTDSAATVDVHASYVTRSGSTDIPGSQNSAISSATTTTVVAAPSSGQRNVRRLSIVNRSAATSVTITVELFDGTTAYRLHQRVLGPGQPLEYLEGRWFADSPSAGPQTSPWFTRLAGCYGDGNPGELMLHVQRAGNVAPTPTNISTSVARCSSFMLPFDLTVNRIRAFGVGSTTGVYRVAIYRMSDLARLTAELSFNTAVDTWVSIGSALNVTLTKDVCYFIACSVNATGTTAGLTAFGGTTTATTGRVNTAPGSLPGSMALGATNYLNHFQFQFAVTTGALPNPAATLVAPAAWTGGMPAFWLDNSDT